MRHFSRQQPPEKCSQCQKRAGRFLNAQNVLVCLQCAEGPKLRVVQVNEVVLE